MEFKGLMCLVFMVIVIVALANEDEHGVILLTRYRTSTVLSVHTTGGSVNTLTSMGHPRGITYDPKSRTVYAVHDAPNGISSFPLDNPGTLTTVTDLPSGYPADITVDTVRRHLYVSDLDNHVIYRVDTDGGNMLTWVKTEGDVWAVKVAELSGYMYWAEVEHATIMRASVTDAAQKEVFINNTDHPMGLYIDEVVNTIYWCEKVTHMVKSAAVDRSHQRTITTITEAGWLFQMSGLPGHLFVIGISQEGEGVIYDISIQEGTYTQLQTNDRINPWFIVAIQNMNECEPGSWNLYCNSKCGHCYGGVPCNTVTGECESCQDGYLLPLCTDCASGYWNVSCNSRCGHCYGGEPCNTVTGECERCEDGYNTPLCTDCAPGYWNVSCNSICGHCYGGEPCNTVTGECKRCEDGYWTISCNSKCGHCYDGEPCHTVTGECEICEDGYNTPLCTDCAPGYWNVSCNSRCGHCYGGELCNTKTGECEICEDGYNTPLCTDCAPGYWNVSCNSSCGHCYGGEPCNTKTGECERCEDGYATPLCTDLVSVSSGDYIINIIIPVMVVFAVALIPFGVFLVILRLKGYICRDRRRLHRTRTAGEGEGIGMHPIEGTEAGVPAREGKEPGVPAREGKEEAIYHVGENELSPIKVKDDERDEDSTHLTEQASAAVYSNEITKNDIDDPYGDESDLTSDVLCTNEIIKNYIDDPYGDESDLTSDVFCANEIIENYIDDPYGDESDLTSDVLDETH